MLITTNWRVYKILCSTFGGVDDMTGCQPLYQKVATTFFQCIFMTWYLGSKKCNQQTPKKNSAAPVSCFLDVFDHWNRFEKILQRQKSFFQIGSKLSETCTAHEPLLLKSFHRCRFWYSWLVKDPKIPNFIKSNKKKRRGTFRRNIADSLTFWTPYIPLKIENFSKRYIFFKFKCNFDIIEDGELKIVCPLLLRGIYSFMLSD